MGDFFNLFRQWHELTVLNDIKYGELNGYGWIITGSKVKGEMIIGLYS